MIKACELRIGNNVEYGAHGIVIVNEIKATGKVRVTHTEQHSIDSGYINSLLAEDNLTPIPLTPEILDKCGFKDKGQYESWVGGAKGHMYGSGDVEIIIDKITGNIYRLESTNGDEFGYCMGPALLSLHQLQNLFFALTGEELAIKEIV